MKIAFLCTFLSLAGPGWAQLRSGEQPRFVLQVLSELYGPVADLGNHVFHNDDRIRFNLLPGFDGYVYVVTVDSNGGRTLLFPRGSTGNFAAGHSYSAIPQASWFGFTFHNMTEQLEVYLSRTPIPTYESARGSGNLAPGLFVARTESGMRSLYNPQTPGTAGQVMPDSIVVSAQVPAQSFPPDGVIGTTLLVPHAQPPR